MVVEEERRSRRAVAEVVVVRVVVDAPSHSIAFDLNISDAVPP